MKFGVTLVPRVSDWKLFVDLETMGYDAAWGGRFADALFRRLRGAGAGGGQHLAPSGSAPAVGGGGAAGAGSPPIRSPPSTSWRPAGCSSIGTAHTAMRVNGQGSVKAGAFREYLRVLRALLHGEEVDYALGDGAQAASAPDIRFLHLPTRASSTSTSGADLRRGRRPLALKTAAPMARAGVFAQPDRGQAAEEPGGDAGWCRQPSPRPARRLPHLPL